MMRLNKYAEHFIKLELMKAEIEFFQNDCGRKGLDFIIKTREGNYHELYLQSFSIEKENGIKILKEELQKPKPNLWIAIAMITKNMDCSIYLVPSIILLEPDKHSFIVNELDNKPYWELIISIEVIPDLSKFSLPYVLKEI